MRLGRSGDDHLRGSEQFALDRLPGEPVSTGNDHRVEGARVVGRDGPVELQSGRGHHAVPRGEITVMA
jgi:hypothetical protein